MSNHQDEKSTQLNNHLDMMDKVIDALGSAVGIANSIHDISTGTISYTPQEKDYTMIRELYKNDDARPIIDKFVEVGKIDKAMLGLDT